MLPKNRDGSPKTTSPCYLCSEEAPSRSKQGRHVQGKISDPMLDFKISGMNNIRNIHPSNHQCKGFRVTFVSAHLIRYGCAVKDPVFISIFPTVSRKFLLPVLWREGHTHGPSGYRKRYAGRIGVGERKIKRGRAIFNDMTVQTMQLPAAADPIVSALKPHPIFHKIQ